MRIFFPKRALIGRTWLPLTGCFLKGQILINKETIDENKLLDLVLDAGAKT